MDPETKQRIIVHMNRDHQIALVDYVVVYGRQPIRTFRPNTVEIADISTESMKLRFELSDGTIKAIDIEWSKADEAESVSVESSSDIKPKLVSMAKYAAKRRGYSHNQITKYAPPKTGLSYFMYASAALLTATLLKPDLISGTFKALPFNRLPFLSKWLYVERNIRTIWYTIYGIHLAEMLLVLSPQIKYHRMPAQTAATWLGMNFIEGFLPLLRLRKMIKEQN